MPGIQTKKQISKLRKEYLSENAKKWKIVKRILGEQVKKYKHSFNVCGLTPPKIALQSHLWALYTNKDLTKPLPALRNLGEELGRKVFDEFQALGLISPHSSWHVETPEERVLYKEISRMRALPKTWGEKKLGIETRLPGLVAAIKEFKKKASKKSMGEFLIFISKKEYTQKTPYEIGQYALYVNDGLIYHLDRTKKDKKGKIKPKWNRPLKISSLDRYYYQYTK